MLTLLISMAATAVASGSPADARGVWRTGGGWASVQIADCDPRTLNPELCGRIVSLRRPNDRSGAPLRDVANPDPGLRSRTLVGLPWITGFRSAGPKSWKGGKIYDPDSGKTYAAKMKLRDDGALEVSGCVLVFCQAQVWRRAP